MTILDLLYSSLHLEVPDWTDKFEVTMRTADPCAAAARKEWRLSEGVTAAAGSDILPVLSKSLPNLVESQVLSSYLKSEEITGTVSKLNHCRYIRYTNHYLFQLTFPNG